MQTIGKQPVTIGHQVFISYATEKGDSTQSDLPIAEKICSALESRGIRCWMAHRDILPGGDWLNSMIEAVMQSQIMVLVFSSNTNKSPWVVQEVTRTLRENITIIPFRIENVSPMKGLRALEDRCQWMDAFTPPLEKHLDRLVKVVHTYLKKEPEKPLKIVEKKPETVEVDVTKEVKKKERIPKRVPKRKWILAAVLIIALFAIGIFFKDPLMNLLHGKPYDVRVVESKGIKVEKNKKGFWEAQYRDGIVMIYIPEGEFIMGSSDGEIDEKPSRKVYLDGYWIGKTEVSVKQYMKFVNDIKSHCPEWLEKGHKDNIKTGDSGVYKRFGSALEDDNYPIVGISWYNAKAYCDWLSQKRVLRFKLPTEAQWEKAARGRDDRKYPWGDPGSYYNGKYYANYNPGNYKEDGFKYTAPVDSFHQGESTYGLLNVAGNVWEWCNDWYDRDYYKKDPPQKNPMGPRSGTNRVLRGGGWGDSVGGIRCASRGVAGPSGRSSDVGFRLCQEKD